MKLRLLFSNHALTRKYLRKINIRSNFEFIEISLNSILHFWNNMNSLLKTEDKNLLKFFSKSKKCFQNCLNLNQLFLQIPQVPDRDSYLQCWDSGDLRRGRDLGPGLRRLHRPWRNLLRPHHHERPQLRRRFSGDGGRWQRERWIRRWRRRGGRRGRRGWWGVGGEARKTPAPLQTVDSRSSTKIQHPL